MRLKKDCKAQADDFSSVPQVSFQKASARDPGELASRSNADDDRRCVMGGRFWVRRRGLRRRPGVAQRFLWRCSRLWAEEKRQKDVTTEKWGGPTENYFSVPNFSVYPRGRSRRRNARARR